MPSFAKGLAFIFLAILITDRLPGTPVVQAHDHGHSHDENPAFKYSKAANEKVIEDEILEEDIIDLPPSHGHTHGGGHHGHSHGHHGHSHGHGHVEPEMTEAERQKARQKLHQNWDPDDEDEEQSFFASAKMNALLAVCIISIFPFFILFFIPLDNSEENEGWMKIILSFACGGLLGDAFLHLIPHAMMALESGEGHHGHSHSHGHGHSHGSGEEHEPHDLRIGLGVLAGIFAFLAVEKVVRIYKSGNNGGHGHSHGPPVKPVKKEESKKSEKSEKEAKKDEKNGGGKKSQEKQQASEEEKEVKVAGYLNLAADAFHNFTDGLAIGASFMAGNPIGFSTTISILFHEIPHEIGDYAILIQSGVHPFKAKLLQTVTALAAVVGCLVAIYAQGAGQAAASVFILPFTAGGFIYIATVSIIPELLEGSSFKQSLCEIVALLIGVFMMVVISWYE